MAKVIVSWTALPRAKDVFRSPHRPKAWTIALYITLRNKKGNIFCKDPSYRIYTLYHLKKLKVLFHKNRFWME